MNFLKFDERISGIQLANDIEPTNEQLLKTLRRFRGRMPADFRFDRDTANER